MTDPGPRLAEAPTTVPLGEDLCVTVAEFARTFRIEEPTVTRLCRIGEVPAVKIGKSYRIARWYVDSLLAQLVNKTA